ncbi:tRNA (guanosine(46)-N7)-methyltransferase TrmB [Pseudostreptobacillus hongkongensis]|uniref:tRNA (guanosine(46)-N7)-methyltransferase TrmB n=1 Tax=Pseudostreptobacillus hongkongensis TaxID=1162717 RepID=UPI0008338344|nr:tRNA (guanosine(46)-N7)-methyltransferase TrmB [Pseudostreptobacillus hongkongensis]
MGKKELWEYFFEKPKKHYNKYMFEMPNYPDYLIYDDEYIVNSKGNWSKVFGNNNPIYLEIGSGSANFTNNMALREKDINFLGVELRFKRLIQAARKAEKLQLENLKFLKKRVDSLKEFIGENELDGLYINFPDPWEGEEHKRIFGEKLISDLNLVLKKNGKIYFKTDHLQYYLDILELINSIDGYSVVYHTDDLHNSPYDETNIKTEFENLFLSKHNMNIKYIEIIKEK